MTFLLN